MNFTPGPTGRRLPIGALVIRLLLAVVFLYAGAAKILAEPGGFADSIASFRILPAALVSPLALALPTFELLVGGALLVGRPRRLGAFCALVPSTAFVLALVAAMARRIPVECGCFGSGPGWLPLTADQRVWFDLGRDVLMAAGALFLYRYETVSHPTRANA